jgi:hypothetical protein
VTSPPQVDAIGLRDITGDNITPVKEEFEFNEDEEDDIIK